MLQPFGPFRLVILMLALLSSVPALAQAGRIVGQVTDQQGASVAGAAVQIVSQDSTIKREVKTDSAGSFAVPFLPPGKYQVLIQAKGFGSATSGIIPLAVNQQFVFDIKLSVASAQSEITVDAGAASTQVELGTATLSTTLSEKEVTSYGLNGRNFSQLMSLAPGVSNQTGQDEAKVGVAGSAKFSVNGGRVEYNTFEVDGSDVLNTSINASRGQGEPLMVYPSIDAIQEMKVLTANYSALYGKSASGSVVVTTKAGGDKFHGNAYEFIRNEMFNARNYFAQPGRTPLYRRQDFGATLGGPLFIPHLYDRKKSKTFFFFSEEVRLEKTPQSYNQAVPTMAERGQGTAGQLGLTGLYGVGDFTDVCGLRVPDTTYTTAGHPDCPSQPGQAGVPAPAVNISYVSRAILNTGIIPAPNSRFGCNTTNTSPEPTCYITSVSPFTFWREELFRIDHSVTPTQQLTFRYVHDAWNTTTLTPQWGVVQNSFPTVENKLVGPGLDMVLALAQTLPHGFLNRLAFAYSVEHISLSPEPGIGLTSLQRPTLLDDPAAVPGGTPVFGSPLCATVYSANSQYGSTLNECPIGHIFDNGFGGGKMPGLVFQGTNGAYGGHGFAVDTGFAPWNQANPTFDLRDDASKTVGHHTLQFGFEGTLVEQNELSAVSGANSGDLQGLLTFSNQQSLYTSGNAFVDFLAGPGLAPSVGGFPFSTQYAQTAIKSYTQDSGQMKYYNRYKIAELYLQDDWRLNSRLTLNAGIRTSLFGTWYNAKGSAYNWTPAAYSDQVGKTIAINQQYGYDERLNNANGGLPSTPVPLNLNNLDPVITNGLIQCGANGVPTSCMKSHVFNPAPRVGFSWDLFGNGKTAIRGGYGLFWEHGTGYEANSGSLIGSAPKVLSETQSNISPLAPTFTYNIPSVGAYNAIGLSCQGGPGQCGNIPVPAGGANFPVNVTSIPSQAVYSYTQQWSLSLQHELQKNTVIQMAYVGAKGTHLTSVSDLNQLDPAVSNPFNPGQPITSTVCGSSPFSTAGTVGPTNPISAGIGPGSAAYTNLLVACTGNPGFKSGISADTVRRYHGFSNIIGVANNADSQYHAFQGTLRETTKPLTIAIAYTYSHSIDDSSDRASANFANSLDLRSNRASSDFDQRHLLNVSYIYALPLIHLLHGFNSLVGRGADVEGKEAASTPAAPKPKDSRLLTNFLGGWELSGITTYQTGTPFSVINGGSPDGTGAADNAGVGDGLGIGSYVDMAAGAAKGIKPAVGASASTAYTFGPLLLNPGAFQAPQGLTFGNTGRNYLNNPSRINFNASLLKTFKVGERLNFEFRTEAFNVFNHTQFRIYDPSHPGNTGNNVANCYGGIVTGYSAGASTCLAGNSFLHPVDAHDPRILQFGLKMAY